MEYEYSHGRKREETVVCDRFAVNTCGSSARMVSEDEIDPVELREKQLDCGGAEARFIMMFCERYRDRGIAGRVHADAVKQEKKEALAHATAPGAFVKAEQLADSMTPAKKTAKKNVEGEHLDAYRSGVSDGRRYMTVDDFARYYHDQRGYKFPQYRQATDAERIAAVRAVVNPRETRLEPPKKAVWLTDTDKLPKFLRTLLAKPAFMRLNEWAGETFPREHEVRTETRSESGHRRPVPVGLVAALVTVAVSMSMVIAGTVSVSQATRELSQQKEMLAELKEAHGELSDQLSLKNDSLDIEDKATNELGMVPEKFLDGEYITENTEDRLEVFDEDRDGEGKTGLAWLLSAFGFGD